MTGTWTGTRQTKLQTLLTVTGLSAPQISGAADAAKRGAMDHSPSSELRTQHGIRIARTWG